MKSYQLQMKSPITAWFTLTYMVGWPLVAPRLSTGTLLVITYTQWGLASRPSGILVPTRAREPLVTAVTMTQTGKTGSNVIQQLQKPWS